MGIFPNSDTFHQYNSLVEPFWSYKHVRFTINSWICQVVANVICRIIPSFNMCTMSTVTILAVTHSETSHSGDPLMRRHLSTEVTSLWLMFHLWWGGHLGSLHWGVLGLEVPLYYVWRSPVATTFNNIGGKCISATITMVKLAQQITYIMVKK